LHRQLHENFLEREVEEGEARRQQFSLFLSIKKFPSEREFREANSQFGDSSESSKAIIRAAFPAKRQKSAFWWDDGLSNSVVDQILKDDAVRIEPDGSVYIRRKVPSKLEPLEIFASEIEANSEGARVSFRYKGKLIPVAPLLERKFGSITAKAEEELPKKVRAKKVTKESQENNPGDQS
jgi:hypothetical protein